MGDYNYQHFDKYVRSGAAGVVLSPSTRFDAHELNATTSPSPRAVK